MLLNDTCPALESHHLDRLVEVLNTCARTSPQPFHVAPVSVDETGATGVRVRVYGLPNRAERTLTCRAMWFNNKVSACAHLSGMLQVCLARKHAFSVAEQPTPSEAAFAVAGAGVRASIPAQACGSEAASRFEKALSQCWLPQPVHYTETALSAEESAPFFERMRL